MKVLTALVVSTLLSTGSLSAYQALTTFTDNFNDGDFKGWLCQRMDWEVIGGELHAFQAGNPSQISSPLGSVTDFELEFAIRYGGSGYGGGCFFRTAGDGKYIQWIYDALSGNLLLSWEYDGDGDVLYERYVGVDTDWHTMKVRMIGDMITVWWDNNLETTQQLSNPNLSEGHITLIGKGPDPSVYYDNVRITIGACMPR